MSLKGLYASFQTNSDIETSGVFLNYGENSNGDIMRVKIRRAGGANKGFQKALTHKMRPYRRQLETQTLDEAVANGIMHEVYAETVIIGWENIEDAEGKILPFSVENAKKLFGDLPDWFADIREQSNSVALFRADILEASAKN